MFCTAAAGEALAGGALRGPGAKTYPVNDPQDGMRRCEDAQGTGSSAGQAQTIAPSARGGRDRGWWRLGQGVERSGGGCGCGEMRAIFGSARGETGRLLSFQC